jgi:putative effector of murein hydrolase
VKSTPLGHLALALGIAALPALFLFMLGLPLGLAAVAVGAVGTARNDRRRTAVAGLVLGLIAVAAAIFLIARPDD